MRSYLWTPGGEEEEGATLLSWMCVTGRFLFSKSSESLEEDEEVVEEEPVVLAARIKVDDAAVGAPLVDCQSGFAQRVTVRVVGCPCVWCGG